jgi:putative polyhydroxyalkanoate system protein
MATIDIRRSHALDRQVVRQKSEELARSMEEKLGIRWRWEGEQIRFDAPSGKAKGVSGSVSVDASTVRVEIDLPFLMRPIKGMVESKVSQKLADLLVKA